MKLFCLGLALALVTVVTAIPPIDQVFRVNVDPNSKSTCARPYRDQQIFKPEDAPGSGSDGLLNIIWDQLYMILDNANRAVKEEEYNNPSHHRTRALLHAFFGIEPKEQADWGAGLKLFEYSDEIHTEPESTYWRKLNSVRYNIKKAWRIITTQGDVRLMCGGTFMLFQTANDEVKERNGDSIPIDPNDASKGNWKLKAWEESHMRDFESRWYFWYSVMGDKGYIVLDKSGYPAVPGTNAPWANNPLTNEPDVCYGHGGASHGNLGSTILGASKCGGYDSDLSDCGSGDGGMDSSNDDGAADWSEDSWIALCDESFSKGALHASPQEPPADRASLDSQELRVITLLHEIFHVTEPQNDDFNKRKPLPGQSDLSSKSQFEEIEGTPTSGAGDCMALAIWEMLEPSTASYAALTTRNPESYAWVTLALWLQAIWNIDFSTGVCLS